MLPDETMIRYGGNRDNDVHALSSPELGGTEEVEGEGKLISIFSSLASRPSRPRLLPIETSRLERGSELPAGSTFSRLASTPVPGSGLPLLRDRDTRRLMPFFSLENESRIPMSVSGRHRVVVR